MKRGEIYLADLNPTRGSEQAGVRPVILVQRNSLNRFTRTVVVVPLTTNLRRSQIPGTVIIAAGTGGLTQDSVALCYQIVVLDQARLSRYLGNLAEADLKQLETALRYTLQFGVAASHIYCAGSAGAH